MKIAIDISQIVYGTGVSYYTKNLVSKLIELDNDNRYVIFGGSLRRFNELKKEASNICENYENRSLVKIYPFPPNLADFVWNNLHILPIENLIGRVDVFHSSDWSQPPSKAFKITTIHDLVPILYPKISDPKLVAVHKRRLSIVAKEIDRIIVPSVTTVNDLVQIGFNEKTIRLIPEAPNSIFKSLKPEVIEPVKRKYKILGKYMLTIGTAPRKNLSRIIAAYERIKPDMDIKLVVVGEKSSSFEAGRGVIFLGRVPTHDLPALFSGSTLLVYPSLYEGFGLPILEAYASRTPVVTSNIGSMKEVAGGASELVDPYSVDSITKGILNAISNKKELIKRGRDVSRKYSWDKTAHMTLEVYEESKF